MACFDMDETIGFHEHVLYYFLKSYINVPAQLC